MMTDFDRRLIEKAKRFHRYDWDRIGVLMKVADTDEGRERLGDVRHELYELTRGTV